MMALTRATLTVAESDLQYMALDKGELPRELEGFQVARESVLDNETMAHQGFPNATAERYRNAGRVVGYMREFGATTAMVAEGKSDVIAGTVAHLFDSPEAVVGWMHNVFLKDFQDNVGKRVGADQELVSVQRLEPAGFFDEAVAVKALHEGPSGLIASTIVDFRVGRILGVAFIGATGDQERLELATKLGLILEKRIVRVVLGGM